MKASSWERSYSILPNKVLDLNSSNSEVPSFIYFKEGVKKIYRQRGLIFKN